MREDTNDMTVAEVADYRASQATRGWPGSTSIHPRVRYKKSGTSKKKNTAMPRRRPFKCYKCGVRYPVGTEHKCGVRR